MEELITSAAANGFPIAVAVYLLIRMEAEMKALREAIETLRHCQKCQLSPKWKDSDLTA